MDSMVPNSLPNTEVELRNGEGVKSLHRRRSAPMLSVITPSDARGDDVRLVRKAESARKLSHQGFQSPQRWPTEPRCYSASKAGSVGTLNRQWSSSSRLSLAASPMKNSADAATCYATGDGLRVQYLRCAASFTLVAADGAGERLSTGCVPFSVRIHGPSHVFPKLADKGDGTYSCEWVVPPISGTYLISVTLDGKHIRGSPFSSVATAAGASGGNSKVFIATEGRAQPLRALEARAGEETGFCFTLADAGGADVAREALYVRLQRVGDSIAPPLMKRKSSAGASPRRFEHRVDEIVGEIKRFACSMAARDEMGNGGAEVNAEEITPKLAVESAGELAGGLEGQLAPDAASQESVAYRAHFSVEDAGDYLVHVKLKRSGEALVDSPLSLRVVAAAAAAAGTHALSSAPPLLCKAGERASVRFATKDMFGNKCLDGGAPFVVQSEGDISCEIIDLADGSYEVGWRGERSGVHAINIMLNGEHVPSSPLHVRVTNAEMAPTRCVVSSGGLTHIVAGKEIKFEVRCADAFGNRITDASQLDGWRFVLAQDVHGEVRGLELSTGRWSEETQTFVLRYTSTLSGRMNLRVLAISNEDAVEVPHSASTLNIVSAETAAEHTEILDAQVHGDREVAADDGSTIVVRCADKFGNLCAPSAAQALTATLRSPSGAESALDLEPISILGSPDGSSFQIQLAPTAVGTHRLCVMLDGEEVVGSPLNLNVSAGRAAAKASLLTRLSNAVTARQPACFSVQPCDAFGNLIRNCESASAIHLAARVDGPAKVKCSIEPNTDGSFTVSAQTQMSGEYRLSVTMNGELLPDCPLSFAVLPCVESTQLRRLSSVSSVASNMRISTGDCAIPSNLETISPGRGCTSPRSRPAASPRSPRKHFVKSESQTTVRSRPASIDLGAASVDLAQSGLASPLVKNESKIPSPQKIQSSSPRTKPASGPNSLHTSKCFNFGIHESKIPSPKKLMSPTSTTAACTA
uniref:Ig-like domain-containing protein n=2 Tax=Chrysotila carterae TaxID=13221 RepID=A0A7S4B3Y2_CHRCT